MFVLDVALQRATPRTPVDGVSFLIHSPSPWERWNMLESLTLVQGSGCKVQGVGFTLQPVGFTLRCSQVGRAHLSRDLCPSPSNFPFPLPPSLAHPPSDDVALKYWCWRRGEEPLHAEYGQVQRGVSSVYHQLSHSSSGCWGLLQPVA
jgi:hypothetical protein